ncbi:MAG: hypothetical protein CL886_08860 [Dehalococcoidia bacterium]|nr:hypothetical protein [Dehalococcoidia bacterium]
MALTTFRIKVNGEWYSIQIGDLNQSEVEVIVDGESFFVEIDPLLFRTNTRRPPTRVRMESDSELPPSDNYDSMKILRSPMPGKVMSISVRPGESVTSGQELCVVEAMKMEQSICSPMEGVVKTIHVQPLDSVNAGDPLIELQ